MVRGNDGRRLVVDTETRYQAVLDALGEALLIWRADGSLLSCNPAAAELLGIPLEQLARMTYEELRRHAVQHDLVPAGLSSLPLDELRHTVIGIPNHTAIRSQVITHRDATGSLRSFEVDACALDDPFEGSLIVVSLRDITARIEAEQRLRFQAGLLDAIGQVVIAVELPSGKITYWNRGAEDLFDCPAHEVVGTRINDYDVEVARNASDAIASALHGEPWAGELAFRRDDGRNFALVVSHTLVHDDHGDVVGVIATCSDVTERKAAEDRARALSALVESSNDAIVLMSVDGTVEAWNRAAEQLLGYRADEIIGRPIALIVAPEHQHRLGPANAAVAAGKSLSNRMTRVIHKDGTERYVSITLSAVRDAADTVVGVSLIARDVGALVAARNALAESEERFRALVQGSADVAMVLDYDGVITYVSPAVHRMGYTPEDLVGAYARELIHPDDFARYREAVVDSLTESGHARIEWRVRHANGEYHWSEGIFTDMSDVPTIRGITVNSRDITDRKRAEDERRSAEERYRHGFDRSAFGIALLDVNLTLTSVNPALATLLGHSPDELIGRTPFEFFEAGEAEAARAAIEHLTRPDAPIHYKREHHMRVANGETAFVLVDATLVPADDGNPDYYFLQVRDITDRKRAEAALAHQAVHDDLTDLPNRVLLVDRLTQSLARVQRTGSQLAVLFLDIDRFKLVNDGMGHAAGDQLLVAVARRLESLVRACDTVARFGGDEFVVVLEDMRNEQDTIVFAERVAGVLAEPIMINERDVYATMSIGVAIADAGTSSAEQLLRDADAAMYRAKDLGRARIELCSADLRRRVADRFDLETALRTALERDEFRLLFQPIVRLRNGRVVGAETLLRWERDGHVLQPDEFIPIAEESGLIVPIGAWVLEHALAEMRHFAASRVGQLEWPLLSVNLSVFQLRLPASVSMVRHAIMTSGVDPSLLSLEITESALMQDADVSANAMHSLRELGVRFAIDDFGTGYSSLAYLKRLPIDFLKIDRSFVDGLPTEPLDCSITETIITLGRVLGLEIVAEGVETVEQWIALEELGCTVGQGFLWSPPVTAAQFARLIACDFEDLRATG